MPTPVSALIHAATMVWKNNNNNNLQRVSGRQIRKITILSKPVLNPWFITGYTDGEGCFSIGFYKRLSSPSGFKI